MFQVIYYKTVTDPVHRVRAKNKSSLSVSFGSITDSEWTETLNCVLSAISCFPEYCQLRQPTRTSASTAHSCLLLVYFSHRLTYTTASVQKNLRCCQISVYFLLTCMTSVRVDYRNKINKKQVHLIIHITCAVHVTQESAKIFLDLNSCCTG